MRIAIPYGSDDAAIFRAFPQDFRQITAAFGAGMIVEQAGFYFHRAHAVDDAHGFVAVAAEGVQYIAGAAVVGGDHAVQSAGGVANAGEVAGVEDVQIGAAQLDVAPI